MSTDHMDRAYMGNLLLNPGEIMYIVYNGRILDRYKYKKLLSTTSNPNNNLQTLEPQQHYVQLKFRLLGGIDRQNRVGSKFGGGGVSSAQHSERERKERLRQLALETVDLAKDPYLMRNHLGTYECKLCLTLHTNEGNYLAHTQRKKHPFMTEPNTSTPKSSQTAIFILILLYGLYPTTSKSSYTKSSIPFLSGLIFNLGNARGVRSICSFNAST